MVLELKSLTSSWVNWQRQCKMTGTCTGCYGNREAECSYFSQLQSPICKMGTVSLPGVSWRILGLCLSHDTVGAHCSSTTRANVYSAEFLPWHLQLSPAKVETHSVGLDSVLWEENIPRDLDKLSWKTSSLSQSLSWRWGLKQPVAS